MNMKLDIKRLTVERASQLLRKREISSRELTQMYLDRIADCDGEIGAYVLTCAEDAMKSAHEADKIFASGDFADKSKLLGIPMAIKDNICTKGVATTCASKLLRGFVPPYDATVMEKLKESGAVMLGKLNMDEFAMGSTTENSGVKLTRNPVSPDRVPGGSSGGSAAAVAADEAVFTLGSDTGGSIRLPASFCGVTGMKPTYGGVSRFGLIAFASSFDQIGPMTSDVRGNADVLDIICGHDAKDSTSSAKIYEKSFSDGIEDGVKGLRIGVAKEFFSDGISSDVKSAIESAVSEYEKLGAEIVEVSFPSLKYALPAYYVISGAEASSNLARFDGIRYGNKADDTETIDELYRKTRDEGFGDEVKRRIMTGTFALSSGYYDAYYKKAQQVRVQIRKEIDEIFKKCDIIASPVSPTTAYKIGENDDDPVRLYLGDIYTVPANIAGLPALSVPCRKFLGGKSASDGLPIGIQLMGSAFSEAMLYRAGYALEQCIKYTRGGK